MHKQTHSIYNYPGIEVYGDIEKNNYCIIESRVHGLFACFYCLLYGLFICEREQVKPVIFLDNTHLYYDPAYGDNIFNYFYKQDVISTSDLPKIKINHPAVFLRWCRISTREKIISNSLINKYFHLKEEITTVIDQFYKKHFLNNNVLAVHYRGKDKIKETAIVPFDIYEKKMKFFLKNNICDRIFFSTDELQLRDYVKKAFKSKVILYGHEGDYSHIHSDEKQGLHFLLKTPYLHAKDALIECYLFSRCRMFLSSHKSSMSLFATFINPELIHIIIEP